MTNARIEELFDKIRSASKDLSDLGRPNIILYSDIYQHLKEVMALDSERFEEALALVPRSALVLLSTNSLKFLIEQRDNYAKECDDELERTIASLRSTNEKVKADNAKERKAFELILATVTEAKFADALATDN